ncbi:MULTISPECIES: hypothetical protein [Vibrio]|uniref:hypothetical protein n=1 Tax=Vibrio TaxID=662 RepID=UPI00207536EA|nr:MULTISPECIES: hypothetical protein [Vibrio]USD32898.1 hypothetical protein J8Z27_01955 [Vibrio sp. SCSIO 43186]USD45938.1 hypothetical protein J4N38_01955 [Vibrio sp. SCSIO 43145]USD70023.1 hypothetical protein J4N41_01955 [Vibrio sp. SCSIO 43139]USD94933.1 hypothetical protein CTT30_01995 [Vibrio coralliilyticus]
MSYDEAVSLYESQQGVAKTMQRNPIKSPASQALEAKRINRIAESSSAAPATPSPQQTAFAETQSNMAWPPYNPLAPEGEKDITDKLKETLERNHTQVQIMTVWDAMVYTVNNWTAMTEDGKTFGADVLETINKIKGYLDNGTEVLHAVFLSRALGSLGIVAKETKTKNGKAAIVISSVWNDSKMHYATVNGINIKKNHPYTMDNPKIQQLGFARNTKIRGAIKAGALTIIISAALATEQLVNNDEYHMVDWYGSVGTELLKLGVTSALALFVISSSMPILLTALIAITIAMIVDSIFDRFEVENKITEELRSATEI